MLPVTHKKLNLGLMTSAFTLITCLASAAPANAHDLAIHAGRLIDTENGRVLRDQMIMIEDDRITDIISADSADLAYDFPIIGLSDATVLPGQPQAY